MKETLPARSRTSQQDPVVAATTTSTAAIGTSVQARALPTIAPKNSWCLNSRNTSKRLRGRNSNSSTAAPGMVCTTMYPSQIRVEARGVAEGAFVVIREATLIITKTLRPQSTPLPMRRQAPRTLAFLGQIIVGGDAVEEEDFIHTSDELEATVPGHIVLHMRCMILVKLGVIRINFQDQHQGFHGYQGRTYLTLISIDHLIVASIPTMVGKS